MPAGASVPASLMPHAHSGEDAFAVAGQLLRGQCVLLLGDSTMTETAHDLAILLHGLSGAALDEYMHRATRMGGNNTYGRAVLQKDANQSLRGQKNQLNISTGRAGARNLSVVFEPNHRKLVFHAEASDTVVVHRFIGHSSVALDFMGIRSLANPEVREEITAMANEHCGVRRRVLWLESGYHDVFGKDASDPKPAWAKPLICKPSNRPLCELHGPERASTSANLTKDPAAYVPAELRSHFKHALHWAETLAPHRLWLSRHASWTSSDHTYEAVVLVHAVRRLDRWVQTALLPPRKAWRYVDYREAWRCSVDAHTEVDVPVHTGAIMRGYHNSSYCCYYLSALRTWQAVLETHEAVSKRSH